MAPADRLLHVPLFRHLPAPALEELSQNLRLRHFGPGDTVFYEGDPGTSLCVIQSGRIKLSLISATGREVIIDLLGPGDVFGELALLDGEPRSADAVATEGADLLLLQRQDFLQFLEEHPKLSIALLAELSRRLRRDTQLIQDAAFLDVPARLARVILRLAEPQGDAASPNQVRATPRLTQTNLAGLVGTTRETLNKFLGMYQDDGLIRLERGRIFVLDEHALKARLF
jgi:CRP-like cAMP-binding protein